MQTKFFLLSEHLVYNLRNLSLIFDGFSAPHAFINDMTVLHAFLLLVSNEMYWHYAKGVMGPFANGFLLP